MLNLARWYHFTLIHTIPLNNPLKPTSGLFKLHHLRSLTLAYCDLYGEIPSSLGNLSHLITLVELDYNHLEGEVPVSVGNLTKLKLIILSNNKLSGNVLVSFANLTKMSHLDISHNRFTGENFPLPLDMSILMWVGTHFPGIFVRPCSWFLL